MEITVNLKEADVKEAVQEYLEKRGWKDVNDIKFNVGTEYYGRDETSSSPVFKNIEAKCTK